MERVGIYEAKSRLSELIEQAEAGNEVTITRHGKPVAKLVPAKAGKPVDRTALFKEISAVRRSIKLKKPLGLRDIREAIEWGRR
ncbi:MAG: type II toxin-antitoxin system prevent-host-death family antitoxin [Betaproteobacteria bacterium]|nr:type II toxin-antitoxin system prevent-host-death family antitoxin [Betaproteobacteria bacterium]